MSRFRIGLGLSIFAVIILAAPIAHACTGNQVLLQDNFQVWASNWGTPDDFHSIKDGHMVISPPFSQADIYFSQGNIFNDMSACVDVAITTGGPKLGFTFAGIAFWSVDVNNTYYLGGCPSRNLLRSALRCRSLHQHRALDVEPGGQDRPESGQSPSRGDEGRSGHSLRQRQTGSPHQWPAAAGWERGRPHRPVGSQDARRLRVLESKDHELKGGRLRAGPTSDKRPS